MILVGNKNDFALQSRITRAYERPSFRALGDFGIYINGRRFGVEAPEATMLACSFDRVQRLLATRGYHTAPFADSPADEIAAAFRDAIYSPDSTAESVYFGLQRREFSKIFSHHHLQWAPDGDEAFDDGSYVLNFDIDDCVRLIGFKISADPNDYSYDRNTLEDIRIPAPILYHVLEEWLAQFDEAWKATPKISESDDRANG